MSDILVATSDNEKNNLLTLGYNKNITIIPNGININGIKCKTSWIENKTILFLALYRKNKGIDLLMESISNLKTNLKGWKIIIAGIESDYTINDLKIMAQQLGISNLIDVTGPLFGEQKWEAYRKADLFILPTLNENFGIVIAESYLCGTPVITTTGAPWKLIQDYKCGWWIERNVKNISNAIMEFLSTPIEERMKMGLTGGKLVRENFSSKTVAQKMIDLYNTVTR